MSLGLHEPIRVNGQSKPAGKCTRRDLFAAVMELSALQATAADRSATAMQDLLRALLGMGNAPEDQTLQEHWDLNPPAVY